MAVSTQPPVAAARVAAWATAEDLLPDSSVAAVPLDRDRDVGFIVGTSREGMSTGADTANDAVLDAETPPVLTDGMFPESPAIPSARAPIPSARAPIPSSDSLNLSDNALDSPGISTARSVSRLVSKSQGLGARRAGLREPFSVTVNLKGATGGSAGMRGDATLSLRKGAILLAIPIPGPTEGPFVCEQVRLHCRGGLALVDHRPGGCMLADAVEAHAGRMLGITTREVRLRLA